jgi:hypothetical protein
MKDAESNRRNNLWRDVTGQMSDHVELAALELRYETSQAKRRALAWAVVLVLVMTGFIILQVAVVAVLMKTGLSLARSSGILALAYFGLGALIYGLRGRRDGRAGPPFAASQKEIKESLRWIQRLFS